MRNTVALAAVLLISILAYVIFFFGQEGSSLSDDDIAFAIPDTAEVGRIVLTPVVKTQPQTSLTLSRTRTTGWQLNKTYPALMPRVNRLLQVMQSLALREVFNEAAQANAQTFLRTVRTDVEVYDHAGNLIKAYSVGSETPDAQGTIMQMDGSDIPVSVEMPGLVGFVKANYSVDPLYWRANILFNGTLSQLSRIEIAYPDAAQDVLLVKGAGENWSMKGGNVNAANLQAYLAAYKGMVYGESFAELSYPGKRQQLAKEQPFARIRVTSPDGSQRGIVLYEQQDNPSTYFGWVEGTEELLTIQRFVIEPFLVRKGQLLDA